MEKNKGRDEIRMLLIQDCDPERVCFPHVEQVAQLQRQVSNRKQETVYLITDMDSTQINASKLLQTIRGYWGIENGLHHRLDVSVNEDCCKVRKRNSVWVLGMFRRLAVSLFIHWKNVNQKAWATMTDFLAFMHRDHDKYAHIAINSKFPSFKRAS